MPSRPPRWPETLTPEERVTLKSKLPVVPEPWEDEGGVTTPDPEAQERAARYRRRRFKRKEIEG